MANKIFILFGLYLNAQTTIEGKVVSKEFNLPLEYANATLHSKNIV
ncbi:hypothetical protein [Lacinutrix jangbogonensis]|nr:hypothetical protein [Lacinutrix jangbogonensis]